MDTGVGPGNKRLVVASTIHLQWCWNDEILCVSKCTYLLDPTSMGSFLGLSLRIASSIAPWTVFRPSQKSRAVLVCEETRGVCVWKPLKRELTWNKTRYSVFFTLLTYVKLVPLYEKNRRYRCIIWMNSAFAQSAIFCPLYFDRRIVFSAVLSVFLRRLLCTFFRTDIWK